MSLDPVDDALSMIFAVDCECRECVRMNIAIGLGERVADLESEYRRLATRNGTALPSIRIEWGGER